MKEKLDMYYKGDFIYENPKLLISEKDIEFSVCAGDVYNGYFTISNDKNTNIKGILESSTPFLRLKTKEFSSSLNRIEYTFDISNFDTSNLESNNTFKENIKVISDCGEEIVSIKVHIVRPYFESKIGKVEDLTRFTSLARYNWPQAVQIFISKEFPSYILANDDKYAFIRKHLLKSKSMNQALEEFLIAVNQKNPVKLTISQDTFNYNLEDEALAEKVVIAKDNWGYIDINIGSDSPFIKIEKSSVNSEEFIGNTYLLEYIILPSKMHKGNNYGRISLKTIYETVTIDIKATLKESPKDKEKRENAILLQSQRINLTKLYLDFRQKKIASSEYISSCNEIITDIKRNISKESSPLASEYLDLLSIQLSILGKEDDQGKDLLDQKEEKAQVWKRDNPDLYWSYIALNSLYSNGTDETYNYPDSKKNILKEMHNLFLNGVKSPYLYYEALKIYNEKPSYLTNLDQFEIQVINFALKIDNLSGNLEDQFIYLASKEKNYKNLVFRSLTKIYHKDQSKEALNGICSLLIKGHKRGSNYFEWYNLGILANLRIAELYEYFMYSIDESKEEKLPHNLLYYFSYSNTLNVQKRSYLYAYIIKNKREIPEIYKNYSINIEKFAYEQMEEGNINESLATIYKDMFTDNHYLMDQRSLLWKVIFRWNLECDNPNIKGVLVAHKELDKETYTPLNKGNVGIDLYNDEAEIFLVSNDDNLYYKDIDYRKTSFMNLDEREISGLPTKDNNPVYLFYRAYNALKKGKYDKKSIKVRQEILEQEALEGIGVSKDFYMENLLSLILYYYKTLDSKEIPESKETSDSKEAPSSSEIDKYIEILESIIKGRKDKYNFDKLRLNKGLYNKYLFIEIFIDRKFYTLAFNEIKKYGFDKVNINKLYDLCTALVRRGYDDSVLTLSYYCFLKDKHNLDIINYLIYYFQGTCLELYKIWEVATSYKINTKELEERILSQILFTNNKETDSFKVYKSFTSKGIDSLLAKAFLNYQGSEYLVKNIQIDERFFESMESLVKTEKNDYCILSLLKYYSSKKSLDEKQIKFVDRFLDEYIKRGIVLPFFKDFKEYVNIPYDFIYKTFVEIKAQPTDKVIICYRYIKVDEPLEDDTYTTAVMDHNIGGIFTKSFPIFYNEKLEYSISVENKKGDIRETKPQTIELGQDMEVNEDNIYNQINFMKLAKDTKDDKTFIDSYNKINKSDYIINKFFKPLDVKPL